MNIVRKYEIVIIAITLMLIAACLFALNEINKVYNIKYEWYSDYKGGFISDKREVLKSGKSISQLKDTLAFYIIGNEKDYEENISKISPFAYKVPQKELSNYIYFCGYLGKYKSQEYDLKFLDISQKQNRVEVLVDVSEPDSQGDKAILDKLQPIEYDDVVRINKKAFYLYPQILVIFKNRDGAELYRTYYNLSNK